MNIGKAVSDAINTFITNFIKGCLTWIFDVIQGTVDVLDNNMKHVATYYAIFLAFSTSLVVAVVIGRIVLTLMKEADGSTDATWANIIMDAIKSAISIPVMVFIQGFLISSITIPLVKYIFSDTKGLTMKTIDHALKVANGNDSGYGIGVSILLLLFFLVVMVVFFIKIGVFIADIAFFNLSIPLVAVSVATESFEYASTWWKKLVYLNITLIAQTVALSLMVASLKLLDKGVGYFAFVIGFGVLVIKAPTILQDLWQSTGMGKATASGGLRQIAMMMRRR